MVSFFVDKDIDGKLTSIHGISLSPNPTFDREQALGKPLLLANFHFLVILLTCSFAPFELANLVFLR